MTRLVLLDGGGVLFGNMTEHSPFLADLARRFAVDAQELRARYEEQDEEFECGRRDGAAAVGLALESLGVSPSEISQSDIRRFYRRTVQPNHELLVFLRTRRKLASGLRYHLTLANNEARDWDAEKDHRFGHLSLCDSLSCSWLLGHAKPRPEYFLTALGQLGFEPDEAILVDDNVDCLSAAQGLGLSVYEYRGTRDLVAMLERF
jgi:HAD superfamily hydrolase (TIGR01509 family)